MAAKDKIHETVKSALAKDGWEITHDPFTMRIGKLDLQVDLGAERLVAAEKGDQKIAVEIKSFVGRSLVAEFHLAVGQFLNYRVAMKAQAPDRVLFLAVLIDVWDEFFQSDLAQLSIREYSLKIIIVDPLKEEIVQWIN
jgi:XisH protein